jgi:hypothetical protein
MITTEQMIESMMNVYSAQSPTMREQYVMRGFLLNLVRAARSELLVEIQQSTRKATSACAMEGMEGMEGMDDFYSPAQKKF